MDLFFCLPGKIYLRVLTYDARWWPGREFGGRQPRDHLRSRLEPWDGYAGERTRVARGAKEGRHYISLDHDRNH